MKSNWNYPTTVWAGENRIEDLSDACKKLNINNPLFVSDRDLIKLSMTQKIINNFEHLKILVIIGKELTKVKFHQLLLFQQLQELALKLAEHQR